MLSVEDKAILDFERAWGCSGPKDFAIESHLGLTASAYYARLGALVNRREAAVYDPFTVKRVLRLIEPGTNMAVS